MESMGQVLKSPTGSHFSLPMSTGRGSDVSSDVNADADAWGVPHFHLLFPFSKTEKLKKRKNLLKLKPKSKNENKYKSSFANKMRAHTETHTHTYLEQSSDIIGTV